MELHKGRVIAAGILCALAATVTVWSGPLASASATFHTAATATASASAPSHASASGSH